MSVTIPPLTATATAAASPANPNWFDLTSVVTGGVPPYQYAWTAGGPVVNLANTHVTANRAGPIVVQLAVEDTAGTVARTSVTVGVAAVASSVSIASGVPSVAVGFTRQLAAVVQDQFGNPMAGQAVTWSGSGAAGFDQRQRLAHRNGVGHLHRHRDVRAGPGHRDRQRRAHGRPVGVVPADDRPERGPGRHADVHGCHAGDDAHDHRVCRHGRPARGRGPGAAGHVRIHGRLRRPGHVHRHGHWPVRDRDRGERRPPAAGAERPHRWAVFPDRSRRRPRVVRPAAAGSGLGVLRRYRRSRRHRGNGRPVRRNAADPLGRRCLRIHDPRRPRRASATAVRSTPWSTAG